MWAAEVNRTGRTHGLLVIAVTVLAGLWAVAGRAAVPAADGADGPPRRHASAARINAAATPVVMDGRLDEPVWGSAPVNTGFAMPLGQANRQPIASDLQTSFQVLYDDDRLYVGVRCNELKMDSLVAEAAPVHDAAMWGDDDVELFLDPVGDRAEYYQLAVNCEGVQTDLYYIEGGNTGKAGWSSDWKAAVQKGADYWCVEMELPFGLFANRPSGTWAENWVFSVARTRRPEPAYYSQFSPSRRYHEVSEFGTLGPIRVDRTRYNLYADAPVFGLRPAQGGFALQASVQVENRGDVPFGGVLAMEILGENSRGTQTNLQLAPRSSARIELEGAYVGSPGKWPVVFRAVRAKGGDVLVTRFDEWLEYTPLAVRVTQPNYRNSIYATQSVAMVKGAVRVGSGDAGEKGLILRVSLGSASLAPRAVECAVEKADVAFELPAADLPVGDYTIRAELLRVKGEVAGKPRTTEALAATEVPLRKLRAAPVVEARVDDQGNLLVNGQPVFIRGWYGSMAYMTGLAAFPQAQLPHSTNFMMGASPFEQNDLGLYTLVGVDRLVDEAKAKLDQPIDDDLRAKLREAMARAHDARQVIGYYLSDEPECRGLSPVFLRSLYAFMAEADPYRVCKIVSRDPARYMPACDVICPHPYMDPQTRADGTRAFGAPLREIQRVVSGAVAANDGSKAVWCMPQTFSYGGLSGRQPDFRESRWFAHTALASGAKGMVPFIFDGYWNHLENHVAMAAVFEELTLLAPAWTARDSASPAGSENPDVIVTAKVCKPEGAARGHVFLVAANQSQAKARAEIRSLALAERQSPRLLVLRENRVVPVEQGRFVDEFAPLGVHVYTTLEVLPDLRTLAEIEAEIGAALRRPADDGNLLASGRVKWWIGEPQRAFASDSALADGVTHAAAWLPVYTDRTQCMVVFEKPVTFSRVVLTSPTILAADLDVWAGGAWKTVHQWRDQYLYRLEYKGPALTTDRLRVRPTAARQGYGSWLVQEITELGVYE